MEGSVNEIWTLPSGDYCGGSKHMDFVYTGNDGSSLLAVSMLLSMPRDGGGIIMTGPSITDILDDRLDLAEQTTVRA